MNFIVLINCLLINSLPVIQSIPSPSSSPVTSTPHPPSPLVRPLPLSKLNSKFSQFRKGSVSSTGSVNTWLNDAPPPAGEATPMGPYITGIHVENDRARTDSDGVNIIYADTETLIRLFGSNFTNGTLIALTRTSSGRATDCNDFSRLDSMSITFISSSMSLIKLKSPKTSDTLYLCAKNVEKGSEEIKDSTRNLNGTVALARNKRKGPAKQSVEPIKQTTTINPGGWIHQGNDSYLTLEVTGHFLPFGLQILMILCLLCLTGLFAGLNLGLMSLDKNELKVIAMKGDENEKRYAKTIEPLRRRGNYLLCTILLSNVAINATLTVLLDQLTSGLLAIVISTLSIVIIGDIIPQAICSRHGLAVGANTIWITYLFMFITAPLSWPVSKILDWLLGDEIGQVYDRERLMEFIRITRDYSQLEPAEVNIISGALELKKKTVGQIMTCLEDVFMLPVATRLDFDTVSKIEKSGFSRIPIYKEDRKNIVGLLYVKDLAFVDPDDNMPLTTLIEYYRHPLIYTWEDTTLDIALGAFKEGKSHLSFVRRLCDDKDHTDPYYEVVGLVTLEDVIEEILQTEIVDETDVFTDNRLKQRRQRPPERDNSVFSSLRHCQDNTAISPQMILATYQYLSSSCSPFANQFITETILRRLLSQRIYFHHVYDPERDDQEPHFQIYTRDKPADYFVMILEGRVQVTAGKEQLTFYGGPFTSFGIDALQIIPPKAPQAIQPSPISRVASTTVIPTSASTTNLITSPTPTLTGSTTIMVTDSPLPAIALSEATLEASFTYKPDYTVEIVQTTTYLKITRKLYLAALKASQMDRDSSTIISSKPSFPQLNSSALLSQAPIDSSSDLLANAKPTNQQYQSYQQHQSNPDQPSLTVVDNPKFNTSSESTSLSFINPSFEMDS